jgi:DNA sulfur modification protein DndB
MFTDLNRYAVRPTKSLNILYDNRDSFSVLLKDCISRIPIFNGSVENEKSSISNRSKALFTLSGIFHATRLFLRGCQLTDDETCNLIISFWNTVASNMVIWQNAKNKKILADVFRREYICAHAITLKALGEVGNRLLKNRVDKALWNDKLSFLQSINWSKDSVELQGLVIVNGRISSSQNNQKAFAEYLIEKSGWASNTEGIQHEHNKTRNQ